MSWRNTTLSHLSAMMLTLGAFAGTAAAQQPLGDFTDQGDVGRVSHPGSGSYDQGSGTYTIAGSGANVWANRDAFHFMWRKMKGDFILTARGALQGKGVEAHRKFGWMIRSSLDSSSAQASAVVHGDGLTSLQFRRTTGAITE